MELEKIHVDVKHKLWSNEYVTEMESRGIYDNIAHHIRPS